MRNSKLPTNLRFTAAGMGKTSFNDAILIAPMDIAKEPEEHYEITYILNEALDKTELRLFAVIAIAEIPNTYAKPSTSKFFTKWSKNWICHPYGSTVGALGSEYSLNRWGFMFPVAAIHHVKQRRIPRWLQTCLLHVYHYMRLSAQPAERHTHDTRYNALTS